MNIFDLQISEYPTTSKKAIESIDWLLKYSKDARWDIVDRAMKILQAGYKEKNNMEK